MFRYFFKLVCVGGVGVGCFCFCLLYTLKLDYIRLRIFHLFCILFVLFCSWKRVKVISSPTNNTKESIFLTLLSADSTLLHGKIILQNKIGRCVRYISNILTSIGYKKPRQEIADWYSCAPMCMIRSHQSTVYRFLLRE